MEYVCISEDEVKAFIEKTEQSLNECFDMLQCFRHGKGKIEEAIFKFQPFLAEILYDSMCFYHKLQKEKNDLISQKNLFDSSTFSHIMKTNAKYSKAIKDTIDIGKNIGDAFVWFFFRDNRDELEKHFEHESTGLYTGGIGGKGELEFIKGYSTIDGLYVIYHGITNMLRIGDFSLYDFYHGIIGVGELKTLKECNKLHISASITSKYKLNSTATDPKDEKAFIESINELKKDFPRIERQLREHDKLLEDRRSDFYADLYSSYDYHMFNSLSPESPVSINSDNSLMILGTWRKENSLFDILMKDEVIEDIPTEILHEKACSMMNPDSPYNAFFIGELQRSTNVMGIPLLWWHLDDVICKNIYFGKLHITTIFNPAKLLQLFSNDGFTIKTSNKLQQYEIYKEIDGAKISIGNFESLCYLITNTFMKTADVYSISSNAIGSIENKKYPSNTKVEMRIRQCNFGQNNKSAIKKMRSKKNGQTENAVGE